VSSFKNNPWLTQQPIAHRGLHDGNRKIPENSMAAFAEAIAKQYPIELDIRIISDGTVIVFHDKNLKRCCGNWLPTLWLKKKSLKKYHLFKTEEHIPTLEEVLDLVNGQVPLLIELKTENLNKRLERNTRKLLAKYSGKVALQSFDPFSVRWLLKNTKYPVGQLAEASPAPWPINKITDYLQLNYNKTPDFLGYDITLMPNKMVSQFKSRGTPVLAWTARSQQQVDQKTMYFDNIIFEGFTPTPQPL